MYLLYISNFDRRGDTQFSSQLVAIYVFSLQNTFYTLDYPSTVEPIG